MLTALREFSLGDRVVGKGEAITLKEQERLPAGRVEQLKHLRLVEEKTDEQVLELKLRELERRIEKLEGSTRSTSTKRGPGRPKKEAA